MPSSTSLTEINSFGDIAAHFHRVRALGRVKGDLGLEDSIEHTLKRVSLVAAYSPQEASLQYRQTYLDLQLKEEALRLITDPGTIESMVIKPPKLVLNDPKAGNPLPFEVVKTDFELLIDHLDILRDDLNFRLRVSGIDGLPSSLEEYLASSKHYGLLRKRLINHLVVKGVYSYARGLELWQHGFDCDKPVGPATFFMLSFDSFKISVDFNKGFF